MEIRVLLLKKFLMYRRNSFRFPCSPEIQFSICIKLLLYEFMRHLWSLETSDYTKNNYSATLLMDKLFDKYLENSKNSFIKSEGWTLGPKTPNVYAYLFHSDHLNSIHFN